MTFFQCSLKGLFKTTWVYKVWFSKTVWFQHLQKWSHASGIITKSALNIFIPFFLVQVTFLRSKINLAWDHLGCLPEMVLCCWKWNNWDHDLLCRRHQKYYNIRQIPLFLWLDLGWGAFALYGAWTVHNYMLINKC